MYLEFQNYKVENSLLNRSIEIDAVSASKNSVIAVECKLTERKRTKKDYFDMLEDTSVPPFTSFNKKEYYIFGANGFEQDLLKIKDDNLHLIDLNNMFNDID